MDVLGLSAAQVQAGGAHWTTREIAQQPQVWPDVARLVAGDSGLADFVTPLLQNPALRILLAGAGTSSFIGECLAPSLARHGGWHADAAATTDIVASPASCLAPHTPTLMVHFARSGNSPESVAAMELAEQQIEECAHLVVTCNAQGALLRRASSARRAQAVLLPEVSNDQSFAMTSSFTGMLLAAGLALRVLTPEPRRIARLARLGVHAMTAWLPVLTSLVRARFERIVYLGSGELKGLAREAGLKMLELTDGRVVSVADGSLAFRHGPKTVLNGSTLVVLFLSNDDYTRSYDLDVFGELRRDGVAGRVIALTHRDDLPQHDDTLVLSDAVGAERPGTAESRAELTDLELCLPFAVFAQSLALLRSLSLGVSPDSPNAAGTVNRVVQGVSIYPYTRTP